MHLKRLYDPETGELTGIKVLSHGKTQKFPQDAINALMGDGLLSMSKGNITIHAETGDLSYKVIRIPGYYCCFDDKKLADEHEAKKYVAANFADQESPDPQNPAGYRKDAFFLCELIEGGE